MRSCFLRLWCLSLIVQPVFSQDSYLVRPFGDKAGPEIRYPGNPEKFTLKASGTVHDSSWYSQWLAVTSSWLLYQREFLQYNAAGSLTEDRNMVLNSSSGQWQNSSRYVYQFGAYNNLLTIRGEQWNNDLQFWALYYRSHYDDMGRMDTTFSKQYDQGSNTYLSGTQTIYSYNSSNIIIEIINQELDTASGNWINGSHTLNTLSASNQLTEVLYQLWNTGTNSWDNISQYLYFYDVSGFALGYVLNYWNTISGSWVPSKQAVYTNNSQGLPVIKLYEDWDPGSSNWQNSEQTSLTYNTSNQVTDILDQLWSPGTLTWKDYYKDHYDYYSSNVEKNHTQWYWNPNSSVWMDTWYSHYDSLGRNLEFYSKMIDLNTYTYTFGYRYLYYYNTQSQPTFYLRYDLNTGNGDWSLVARRLFTYDANGNNTVQVDQTYNAATTSWDNYFRLENFFGYYTGIKSPDAGSRYCFYSNPMTKGSVINCPALEPGKTYRLVLIDMNGRMIFSGSFRAGESQVLPQTLSSGL